MSRSRAHPTELLRALIMSSAATLWLVLAWLAMPGSTPAALAQGTRDPSPDHPPVTVATPGPVTLVSPSAPAGPAAGPLVLIGSFDPATGRVHGALVGQGTGPINPFGGTQPGARANPQNAASSSPYRPPSDSVFLP